MSENKSPTAGSSVLASVPPGIMSSWMATSALAVAELVGPILCLMLTAFSSMCVGVVYGYIGSWQIALVLSAMTPAILAGAIYMMGRMFGKGQSASIYSQGGQVASEAILNIRTVRALKPFTRQRNPSRTRR